MREAARATWCLLNSGTVSIATGFFLLLSGLGYRVVANQMDAMMSIEITLEHPISSLPLAIGDWMGESVELSPAIQRVAGNDDWVSRVYRRSGTGELISIYIGYTGRPRTMLQHRPTVCYPNAGFSLVESEEVALQGRGGHTSPATLQMFLKPGIEDTRTLVLSYYVLNGRVTIDENSFWGLSWRAPRSARGTLRYVAQIQIAAPIILDAAAARRQAIEFAQTSLPEILRLLPGAAGAGGDGQES